MSLAEVENMAILQSFTVGESGHALPGNVRCQLHPVSLWHELYLW